MNSSNWLPQLLLRNQVYFLTNGGTQIYADARRNSLEEAIKLCLASGLQGIVSEVRAIFRDPPAISKIKEASLSLLTYGQLKWVIDPLNIFHFTSYKLAMYVWPRIDTEGCSQ